MRQNVGSSRSLHLHACTKGYIARMKSESNIEQKQWTIFVESQNSSGNCKMGIGFYHLVTNRGLGSYIGSLRWFGQTCYHMAFETIKEWAWIAIKYPYHHCLGIIVAPWHSSWEKMEEEDGETFWRKYSKMKRERDTQMCSLKLENDMIKSFP